MKNMLSVEHKPALEDYIATDGLGKGTQETMLKYLLTLSRQTPEVRTRDFVIQDMSNTNRKKDVG
jgi:hypothetical protein